MQIEICAQVINVEYHKRLNWMLSSITQQKDLHKSYKILFNIAMWDDPSEQKLVDIATYFDKRGMDIKLTKFPDLKTTCDRNKTRNRQVEESSSDWLLFVDSDMVYHNLFFSNLFDQLDNTELKNEVRCISTNRISLDIKFCSDLFLKEDITTYPKIVDDVGLLCSKMPIKSHKKVIKGAGFFQLVNTKIIKAKGNVYTKKRRGESLGFYTSDINFRAYMSPIGNSNDICKIKTMPQYHLNHIKHGKQPCEPNK